MVLKCSVCGHIEKCCVLDCPLCGADMIRLSKAEAPKAIANLKEKVGDPIYPELLTTQCKYCGKRKPLFIIFEKSKTGLIIGICKECYLEGKEDDD
jgi:hypothetical protein